MPTQIPGPRGLFYFPRESPWYHVTTMKTPQAFPITRAANSGRFRALRRSGVFLLLLGLAAALWGCDAGGFTAAPPAVSTPLALSTPALAPEEPSPPVPTSSPVPHLVAT